jgi:hypothetical protein
MSGTLNDDFKTTVILAAVTCSVCQTYFRDSVFDCNGGHSVCSLCYVGVNKPCTVPQCQETFPTTPVTNGNLSSLVRDLGLPVPCKNRRSGCYVIKERDAIKEHEVDCDYRMTNCRMSCAGNTVMYSKMEEHYQTVHTDLVNDGQWHMMRPLEDPGTFGVAMRSWVEEEYGHRFIAYLMHFPGNGQWKSFVRIVAGVEEAKNYRSEVKLCSEEDDDDGTDSITFNGDVFHFSRGLEGYMGLNVDLKTFAHYNKGNEYLVKQDYGGFVVSTSVPIKVKVTKKRQQMHLRYSTNSAKKRKA